MRCMPGLFQQYLSRAACCEEDERRLGWLFLRQSCDGSWMYSGGNEAVEDKARLDRGSSAAAPQRRVFETDPALRFVLLVRATCIHHDPAIATPPVGTVALASSPTPPSSTAGLRLHATTLENRDAAACVRCSPSASTSTDSLCGGRRPSVGWAV